MRKLIQWLKWAFSFSLNSSLKFIRYANLSDTQFKLLEDTYKAQKNRRI